MRGAGVNGEPWRHLLEPLTEADQLHACAGAVDLVAGGPGPSVRLEPTPGHTPGHQSVLVSAAGDHVLIAGDVFTHALQVVEPTSRYVFDQDSDEAVRTRVALLGSARSLGARLGTAHLHAAFISVLTPARPVTTRPRPVSEGRATAIPLGKVVTWLQNGARWRRWPAGPTTGSTCPFPLAGTCGRSSRTTGRSCWERSPCGASWCSWSPACSCPCGSRPACRRRRTRAPTPSCAAYRCRMPIASTLHISFDVRGGLLMRQIHHWAAMVFIAGMLVHLIRVFVTGAFRKPREVTWLIGGTMLLLGVLEGFAGYSLPDDLLSGTGLRIADGIVKATPVVGSYLSFLAFGGEFPGTAAIPRLYIVHVLLIPGLLLALVAAHLLLIVYHKHTQWAGPGRTERNVVGYPFLPVYLAKSTGFFFVVFGTLALMGGLLSINPIWKYGPYDPAKVTAGSQPDWYMGIAEGLLRIFPGWETHVAGHTISWNVLLPGQVLALAPFLLVMAWPFLEAWVTGDKREHHILQRPRDAPTRTAFMAAMIAAYGLLWAAGGNDILATRLHLSLNGITDAIRVAVLVVPPLVFVVARRWCIGLQRADNERLAHGEATGVILRSPEGGYSERHAPVRDDRALDAQAAPVASRPPQASGAGRRRGAAPARQVGPAARPTLTADVRRRTTAPGRRAGGEVADRWADQRPAPVTTPAGDAVATTWSSSCRSLVEPGNAFGRSEPSLADPCAIIR